MIQCELKIKNSHFENLNSFEKGGAGLAEDSKVQITNSTFIR